MFRHSPSDKCIKCMKTPLSMAQVSHAGTLLQFMGAYFRHWLSRLLFMWISQLDHLCELAKVSKFWSKAAQHCSPVSNYLLWEGGIWGSTACPRTRQYIDVVTGDWTSNLLNSRQLALKPEPHWQPISFFKWQLASSKLKSTSTFIHLWIIFPVIFSCSCSSLHILYLHGQVEFLCKEGSSASSTLHCEYIFFFKF